MTIDKKNETTSLPALLPVNGEQSGHYFLALGLLREIESKLLTEAMRMTDANVVIVSAEGVGAGHARQQTELHQSLLQLGKHSDQDRIISISANLLNEDKGKDSKSDFFATIYKKIQQLPPAQDAIHSLMINLPQYQWIRDFADKQLSGMGNRMSQSLKDQLTEAKVTGQFDPSQPTVFVTTHSACVYAIQDIINHPDHEPLFTHDSDITIVEAPPDPWKSNELLAMIAGPIATPAITKKPTRYVITHDFATAQEYLRINQSLPSIILPLGTASEPYGYYRSAVSPEQISHQPLHIMYECSGNPLPQNDLIVSEWLRKIAPELTNGTLRITIESMHHQSTKEFFEKLKNTLPTNAAKNIQIIYDPTIKEAIASRRLCLLGEHPGLSGWGQPQIRLSKGGEVPLENSSIPIVILPSHGHEVADTQAGINENRVLTYLQGAKVDTWLSTIQEKLAEQAQKSVPTLQITNLVEFGVIFALLGNSNLNEALLKATESLESFQQEIGKLNQRILRSLNSISGDTRQEIITNLFLPLYHSSLSFEELINYFVGMKRLQSNP